MVGVAVAQRIEQVGTLHGGLRPGCTLPSPRVSWDWQQPLRPHKRDKAVADNEWIDGPVVMSCLIYWPYCYTPREGYRRYCSVSVSFQRTCMYPYALFNIEHMWALRKTSPRLFILKHALHSNKQTKKLHKTPQNSLGSNMWNVLASHAVFTLCWAANYCQW